MNALLAKNAFYLTFATVFQKIVAFVYFVLLSRFFGLEDTGDYFLALAIITVIMVLDDLGVTSVLIRETAKKSEDATLWLRSVLGIKIFTIPFTILLAFIVPVLMGYSDGIVSLVRIAIIIMIADTLSLTFYGTLRGLQNLRFESVGMFVGQIVTASIGLILMATGSANLQLLVLALATGSTWNLLFSGYTVARKLGFRALVPSWSMGLLPLKMAFAFFLAAAFVKVYSYVDSIILHRILGSAAVGAYAVAYKLTYAFQFIPLAFVGALYPALSAEIGRTEKVKTIIFQSFWYLAIIGAPIVFGLWAVAPEVVLAFYGDEFASSVAVLQVLIFVLIPIFLDFPLGSFLNASGRQGLKTAIGGITMVINVVLNIILIQIMGVMGAAISALVSFTFMFVADWFFIRTYISATVGDVWRSVGKIGLVAIVMAACVVFAKQYIHFTFAIGVGAVVYIVGIFALKIVDRTHIAMFRQLILKRALRSRPVVSITEDV